MSQNTSLPLPARLLCYLGPPSIILLTSLASPRAGLLSPIAFVPTAVAYNTWKRSRTTTETEDRKDVEPLIWTYVGTATVGMTAVMVGQFGILTATTRLLFPDREVRKAFMKEFARSTVQDLLPEEISRRVALSSTWQHWVFIATLSFAMAGLLEETLKASWIYSAKTRSKCTGKPIQKTTYLDFTIASALSFGLLEGIGFLYGAVEAQQETGLKLFRTILERFVYGSSSHVLLAALTGLRAARKDLCGDKLSWWGVVAPSVVLHGCGNTAAFTFSKLEGNVGFIHPTGFWNQAGMYLSLATVNAVAGWLVYKEWTGLQKRSPTAKTDKNS